MTDGPFQRFCDELDALIEAWEDKPNDDQLTHAEVVGALQFKSLCLMLDAQQADQNERGGE